MNYRVDLNDLAIMLTDKIYHQLTHELSMVVFAPTYYNTRMKILEVLTEYIKVATVEHQYSPVMLDIMKNKESYAKHAEDKMLFKMTDFLSENKMFLITTRESQDGWYRKDTCDLFVVDVNKLSNDLAKKSPTK